MIGLLVLLIRPGATLRSNGARVFSLHVQKCPKAPLQCFDFRGDCVTIVMSISLRCGDFGTQTIMSHEFCEMFNRSSSLFILSYLHHVGYVLKFT